MENSAYFTFYNISVLTIAAGFFIPILKISNKNKPLYLSISKIGKWILPVSVVGFVTLYILEWVNWQNYVLYTFHIYYHSIVWVFLLCLEAQLIYEFTFGKLRKIIDMHFSTLLYLTLLVILTNSSFSNLKYFSEDIKFMLAYPLASYDEKMRDKLGDFFYNYTKFIVSHTEPNAKILIPPWPNYPWPQTGNVAYMRYFLYPRELVSGEVFIPPGNINTFDYVLIAYGETETVTNGASHGWPKFDVKAEKIIYMLSDSTTVESDKDYTYGNENKVEWGLIKTAK